jgi:hypothetical protein
MKLLGGGMLLKCSLVLGCAMLPAMIDRRLTVGGLAHELPIRNCLSTCQATSNQLTRACQALAIRANALIDGPCTSESAIGSDRDKDDPRKSVTI